jgi:hypothetical protein
VRETSDYLEHIQEDINLTRPDFKKVTFDIFCFEELKNIGVASSDEDQTCCVMACHVSHPSDRFISRGLD